jgi:hypothetical protein
MFPSVSKFTSDPAAQRTGGSAASHSASDALPKSQDFTVRRLYQRSTETRCGWSAAMMGWTPTATCSASVADVAFRTAWNERLGHLAMFEALEDADDAVKLLLDRACEWLNGRGMEAARAGFLAGVSEFPFRMDAYDVLPPSWLRQNPPSYHRMLKRAGFAVEKGMVDYKLRVTPELERRCEAQRRADEGARRGDRATARSPARPAGP